MRRDAALEIAAELAFDVAGKAAVVLLARVREERLELLTHELVEERRLRVVRRVAAGGRTSGDGDDVARLRHGTRRVASAVPGGAAKDSPILPLRRGGGAMAGFASATSRWSRLA